MELCLWRSTIKIIFSLLLVSLKGKEKTYKQPKTNNSRRHYLIKTANNFSLILFCRYYVDFGSKICLYLIKTKFSSEKGKNQFESCVLKVDFLCLPPKYGLSRTPAWKNTRATNRE